MEAVWKKTRGGKWAVMGLASVVKPGATVEVTRRDGSTSREVIEDVGAPFERDGETYVYGYPKRKHTYTAEEEPF